MASKTAMLHKRPRRSSTFVGRNNHPHGKKPFEKDASSELPSLTTDTEHVQGKTTTCTTRVVVDKMLSLGSTDNSSLLRPTLSKGKPRSKRTSSGATVLDSSRRGISPSKQHKKPTRAKSGPGCNINTRVGHKTRTFVNSKYRNKPVQHIHSDKHVKKSGGREVDETSSSKNDKKTKFQVSPSGEAESSQANLQFRKRLRHDLPKDELWEGLPFNIPMNSSAKIPGDTCTKSSVSNSQDSPSDGVKDPWSSLRNVVKINGKYVPRRTHSFMILHGNGHDTISKGSKKCTNGKNESNIVNKSSSVDEPDEPPSPGSTPMNQGVKTKVREHVINRRAKRVLITKLNPRQANRWAIDQEIGFVSQPEKTENRKKSSLLNYETHMTGGMTTKAPTKHDRITARRVKQSAVPVTKRPQRQTKFKSCDNTMKQANNPDQIAASPTAKAPKHNIVDEENQSETDLSSALCDVFDTGNQSEEKIEELEMGNVSQKKPKRQRAERGQRTKIAEEKQRNRYRDSEYDFTQHPNGSSRGAYHEIEENNSASIIETASETADDIRSTTDPVPSISSENEHETAAIAAGGNEADECRLQNPTLGSDSGQNDRKNKSVSTDNTSYEVVHTRDDGDKLADGGNHTEYEKSQGESGEAANEYRNDSVAAIRHSNAVITSSHRAEQNSCQRKTHELPSNVTDSRRNVQNILKSQDEDTSLLTGTLMAIKTTAEDIHSKNGPTDHINIDAHGEILSHKEEDLVETAVRYAHTDSSATKKDMIGTNGGGGRYHIISNNVSSNQDSIVVEKKSCVCKKGASIPRSRKEVSNRKGRRKLSRRLSRMSTNDFITEVLRHPEDECPQLSKKRVCNIEKPDSHQDDMDPPNAMHGVLTDNGEQIRVADKETLDGASDIEQTHRVEEGEDLSHPGLKKAHSSRTKWRPLKIKLNLSTHSKSARPCNRYRKEENPPSTSLSPQRTQQSSCERNGDYLYSPWLPKIQRRGSSKKHSKSSKNSDWDRLLKSDGTDETISKDFQDSGMKPKQIVKGLKSGLKGCDVVENGPREKYIYNTELTSPMQTIIKTPGTGMIDALSTTGVRPAAPDQSQVTKPSDEAMGSIEDRGHRSRTRSHTKQHGLLEDMARYGQHANHSTENKHPRIHGD